MHGEIYKSISSTFGRVVRLTLKVRIFTPASCFWRSPAGALAPVAAARSGYHGGGEEGSGHGGLAETSPAAPPRQPELRCVPLISWGGQRLILFARLALQAG